MDCCSVADPGPLQAPTDDRKNPWCAICGAEYQLTPFGWKQVKAGATRMHLRGILLPE